MKTAVFDACSPCTSHPDLTLFHFYMHHGLFVDDKGSGSGRLFLRNTFASPSIMIPGEVIVISNDLAARLSPVMRAPVLEIDELCYYLPYEIGNDPPELCGRYSDIEEEIYRYAKKAKVCLSHPSMTYRMIKPRTIASFKQEQHSVVAVNEVAPYSGTRESWDLLGDALQLSREGIIATGFGFQVSDAVAALLWPQLDLPFSRVVTFDLKS